MLRMPLSRLSTFSAIPLSLSISMPLGVIWTFPSCYSSDTPSDGSSPIFRPLIKPSSCMLVMMYRQ